MKVIIRPTIAIVRGELNKPKKHKTNPKNHNAQPKTGTQPKSKPRMAKTKPEVAHPFDFSRLLITTTLFSFLQDFCCKGDASVVIGLNEDSEYPHLGQLIASPL